MSHRIAVIGTGAGFTGSTVPPKEIAAVAGVGFSPELVETRLRTFPRTPYDRGLTVLAYMDAGIEAEKAGYDAVYINTFGDYGIAELKSALSIPVVGSGEASMALAATLGQRFAIVTIWPLSLNFIYRERLRACAMEDRCAAIINVLDDPELDPAAGDPVGDMRAGKSAMLDRIVAACEKAIAVFEADTIVLGCTCMAPIGHAVAARVAAPVIEAMTAGYKMAEAQLTLGLRHSHLAYPATNDASKDIAGALVTGAGLADVGPQDEEECDVCVVSSEAAE